MNSIATRNAANYDAWYDSPGGSWIGDCEFKLLWDLAHPKLTARLLDVGSGTGYFSRRFHGAGLTVTGLEPDEAMRSFAASRNDTVDYVAGHAEALPFENAAFDYVTAITSLCFVSKPEVALAEMWRVCRYGVVLGLLNRHSLLFLRKAGQGSYAGARWDTARDIPKWVRRLSPTPIELRMQTSIIFPGGSAAARLFETLTANRTPWGGFLAIWIAKAPHNKI